MSKKFISIFTMVAFIVFSLSCYSTKNIRLDADTAKENGKIKILNVVTKSGETIEFSKEQPGTVHNGNISGAAIKITGDLDKAYIESKEVDKEGKILRMMVSIPLSEVDVMMIADRKFNYIKTFLCFAAAVGIGLLVYVATYPYD